MLFRSQSASNERQYKFRGVGVVHGFACLPCQGWCAGTSSAESRAAQPRVSSSGGSARSSFQRHSRTDLQIASAEGSVNPAVSQDRRPPDRSSGKRRKLTPNRRQVASDRVRGTSFCCKAFGESVEPSNCTACVLLMHVLASWHLANRPQSRDAHTFEFDR